MWGFSLCPWFWFYFMLFLFVNLLIVVCKWFFLLLGDRRKTWAHKVLYLSHFLRDSRTSEECFIGANRAFIWTLYGHCPSFDFTLVSVLLLLVTLGALHPYMHKSPYVQIKSGNVLFPFPENIFIFKSGWPINFRIVLVSLC